MEIVTGGNVDLSQSGRVKNWGLDPQIPSMSYSQSVASPSPASPGHTARPVPDLLWRWLHSFTIRLL